MQRSTSPLSSKSATHKTGLPIAALDISPERTHAILAGRDILKTIKVGHAGCAEDFNLRAKLSAYAAAHIASRDAASAQHRDQLAAKDVKWSRGNFSTTIATAAANGRIVVYDLNRPSIEVGRLHQHDRQVHKLAFNPHQGALLISGSQDGSVRMWDMRDLRTDRAARIGGSIKRFMGHNEGVRDLKWSPSDGVEFAAGTDSGTIQRWDFRKENAPVLKLNAHDKTCMSLDWHPSGRYLASGSADKTIKVWDFRSTDRRMKPTWQLRAPQAVMNIQWRPRNPLQEGMPDGRPTTYLASSYDSRDPRIHVWDFRRPHVPFQEIDRFDTPATDFLWHSEDLIWSVGVAGMFAQTDLNFVSQPLEQVSINVLSAGPEGDVCFFSEPRASKRAPLADAEELFLRGTATHESSGEKLSGSHSATEGSVEEGSNFTNTLKKRGPKYGSARVVSATPNSTVGFSEETKSSEPPWLNATYRSTQTAAIGRVPGVFDAGAFKYLAQTYQLPEWRKESLDQQNIDLIGEKFSYNATMAARVGEYRLAQTWHILGQALSTELSARSKKLHERATSKAPVALTAPPTAVTETTRSPQTTLIAEVSKVLRGAAAQSESGSNAQTPLARPVREMPSIPPADEHLLEQDSKTANAAATATANATLQTPLWQQRRASVQLSAVPITRPAPSSRLAGEDTSEVEAKDDVKSGHGDSMPRSVAEFADLEQQMQERRSAMNNYRARPRTLLRLDNTNDDNLNFAGGFPPLDRHDSNESFQMIAGSTDSDPRSVPFAESFGDSQSLGTSSNSLGSSVAHDMADSSQMYHTQLRQTQSAAPKSTDDKVATKTAETMEIPSLENMSFSIDPQSEREEEKLAAQTSPWPQHVERPSTLVPPTVHHERSLEDYQQSGTDVEYSSLLLAHPAPPAHDPPPWTLSALLPPLLEYHLETLCDTQIPSILALFLFPFCPDLFSSSPPPPTYLLAYHEILVCLRLFGEAAALRNAAMNIFPDIGLETTAEQGRGTGAEQAGFWCNECGKPVKGDVRGWCKRCCTEWAECAICELPLAPSRGELKPKGISKPETSEHDSPRPSTTLWSWCQGCGHGGHTRCLQSWWRAAAGANGGADASQGACPIPGCNHACILGPRREARLAAAAAATKREHGSAVTRDSWIASESRAVEAAARSLGGRGSSGGATGIHSTLGLGVSGSISRVSAEEAVVVVDPERGGLESGKDILLRSLSSGGRSLSGGGRRVRLALPGSTPPAAASALAGLRNSLGEEAEA